MSAGTTQDARANVDFDVLVVGAGLSGIGAGYRLATECPNARFAIFEARDAIGGTWDLFRYPGIRSDSDMFTLGYPFHPWTEAKAIADGDAILRYVRNTARKFGIDRHIRFRHRVVHASWSSEEAAWTVDVQIGEQGERRRFRARFLYLCSGYYSYERAHDPGFVGVDRFRGRVVSPQWWPADLNWDGQRVVVIGSGATAVTLVPALAERAAHVTMLQRSPGYVASLPARDWFADAARAVLPERAAHGVARAKNVLVALGFYQFCRRMPRLARRVLKRGVAAHLPADFAVETHFSPRYAPWDQRLCIVPDGDLFAAIAAGKASVVTDAIDTFTERGVRLRSGAELEADIIVTATGLHIQPCGGIEIDVDGRHVEPRDAVVYKGLMLSGVPNLAWCVGYTNASWTLRADLSSRYVCRLLNYMDAHGYDRAVPEAPPDDARRPLLDLSAGYVLRAADRLPKQGARAPWHLRQNYVLDRITMELGPVDDAMTFGARA